MEKHDTETNDGKDSSSPLGSFRGCNNQSSASIWPNHLHPLISSTDFLLFLSGLLPASSNLSILLLIDSINVHPLYMPMHFHCYSLLPPKKPQHYSSACWRFSTDTISNPVKSLPLCTPFLSFLLIFCYRTSHLSPFSTRINLYVQYMFLILTLFPTYCIAQDWKPPTVFLVAPSRLTAELGCLSLTRASAVANIHSSPLKANLLISGLPSTFSLLSLQITMSPSKMTFHGTSYVSLCISTVNKKGGQS